MDMGDLKAVMTNLGVDLWSLIETAVGVAARDHGRELLARRDGIVAMLYSQPVASRCQKCDHDDGAPRRCSTKVGEREIILEEREKLVTEERIGEASPLMAQSPYRKEEEEPEEGEEEDDDRDRRRYIRPVDDEQTRILEIKELLDDPDQPEDSLVHMLQTLADMDITFRALKETDIGRHVNGLRKHPSGEIRRLVKLLVRKWKDIVDEWVKSNAHETATPSIINDGDSPQQIQSKTGQNRNQVPDFGHSPNIHNSSHQLSESTGVSGTDKAGREGEMKARPAPPPPRKEAPAKSSHHRPPSPAPAAKAEHHNNNSGRETLLDPEKFASARRRLHENYQEAENAKKQRTIQVMDIHDIPRPKNSFLRADHRGIPGQQAQMRRKI